ncbi:hypothetical protein BDY21DRAFT_358933 [Lineolata rhizophorae]|uniref:Uncharacterized protein n=1 Tax=Lineolata rhizophorae TaxID=578093 RepID=A0A6A6NM86_9PEZI|nr:hypothetical protein BDY21DRAFT_358933 [Lineolata rhizophorae]
MLTSTPENNTDGGTLAGVVGSHRDTALPPEVIHALVQRTGALHAQLRELQRRWYPEDYRPEGEDIAGGGEASMLLPGAAPTAELARPLLMQSSSHLATPPSSTTLPAAIDANEKEDDIGTVLSDLARLVSEVGEFTHTPIRVITSSSPFPHSCRARADASSSPLQRSQHAHDLLKRRLLSPRKAQGDPTRPWVNVEGTDASTDDVSEITTGTAAEKREDLAAKAPAYLGQKDEVPPTSPRPGYRELRGSTDVGSPPSVPSAGPLSTVSPSGRNLRFSTTPATGGNSPRAWRRDFSLRRAALLHRRSLLPAVGGDGDGGSAAAGSASVSEFGARCGSRSDHATSVDNDEEYEILFSGTLPSTPITCTGTETDPKARTKVDREWDGKSGWLRRNDRENDDDAVMQDRAEAEAEASAKDMLMGGLATAPDVKVRRSSGRVAVLKSKDDKTSLKQAHEGVTGTACINSEDHDTEKEDARQEHMQDTASYSIHSSTEQVQSSPPTMSTGDVDEDGEDMVIDLLSNSSRYPRPTIARETDFSDDGRPLHSHSCWRPGSEPRSGPVDGNEIIVLQSPHTPDPGPTQPEPTVEAQQPPVPTILDSSLTSFPVNVCVRDASPLFVPGGGSDSSTSPLSTPPSQFAPSTESKNEADPPNSATSAFEAVGTAETYFLDGEYANALLATPSAGKNERQERLRRRNSVKDGPRLTLGMALATIEASKTDAASRDENEEIGEYEDTKARWASSEGEDVVGIVQVGSESSKGKRKILSESKAVHDEEPQKMAEGSQYMPGQHNGPAFTNQQENTATARAVGPPEPRQDVAAPNPSRDLDALTSPLDEPRLPPILSPAKDKWGFSITQSGASTDAGEHPLAESTGSRTSDAIYALSESLTPQTHTGKSNPNSPKMLSDATATRASAQDPELELVTRGFTTQTASNNSMTLEREAPEGGEGKDVVGAFINWIMHSNDGCWKHAPTKHLLGNIEIRALDHLRLSVAEEEGIKEGLRVWAWARKSHASGTRSSPTTSARAPPSQAAAERMFEDAVFVGEPRDSYYCRLAPNGQGDSSWVVMVGSGLLPDKGDLQDEDTPRRCDGVALTTPLTVIPRTLNLEHALIGTETSATVYIFIVIPASERAKLDECIRRALGEDQKADLMVTALGEPRVRTRGQRGEGKLSKPECPDSTVNHRLLFIPPSTLRMWKVDFTCLVRRVNDRLLVGSGACIQAVCCGFPGRRTGIWSVLEMSWRASAAERNNVARECSECAKRLAVGEGSILPSKTSSTQECEILLSPPWRSPKSELLPPADDQSAVRGVASLRQRRRLMDIASEAVPFAELPLPDERVDRDQPRARGAAPEDWLMTRSSDDNDATAEGMHSPNIPPAESDAPQIKRSPSESPSVEMLPPEEDRQVEADAPRKDKGKGVAHADERPALISISDTSEIPQISINTDSDMPIAAAPTSLLPLASNGTDEECADEIRTIRDFITEHDIPPAFLDSVGPSDYSERLHQFNPGQWVDDVVLRRILLHITAGLRYSVVDSLHLDISRPETLLPHLPDRHEFDGTILPFSVNFADQTAHAGKNHWVVAVLDWSEGMFTGYGIHRNLVKTWANVVGAALCRRLGHATQPLGANDDATCALLCANAVEQHLDAFPKNIALSPVQLRARYFRMLLEAWVAPAQQAMLAGAATTQAEAIPLAKVRSEESTPVPELKLKKYTCVCDTPDAPGVHTCMETDVRSLGKESGNAELFLQALRAEDGNMPDRRARLIQMIMQCSAEHIGPALLEQFPHIFQGFLPDSQPDNEFGRRMFSLLERLERINTHTQASAFARRVTLVELARVFEAELLRTKKDLHGERAKRIRACKYKMEKPPDNKDKRAHAETRALQKMFNGLSADDPRCKKGKWAAVKRQLKQGQTLRFLASRLGTWVLAVLPGDSIKPKAVYPTAKKCFRLFCKDIQPSDYDNMTADRALFFTCWLPLLRPELPRLSSVDSRLLQPIVEAAGAAPAPLSQPYHALPAAAFHSVETAGPSLRNIRPKRAGEGDDTFGAQRKRLRTKLEGPPHFEQQAHVQSSPASPTFNGMYKSVQPPTYSNANYYLTPYQHDPTNPQYAPYASHSHHPHQGVPLQDFQQYQLPPPPQPVATPSPPPPPLCAMMPQQGSAKSNGEEKEPWMEKAGPAPTPAGPVSQFSLERQKRMLSMENEKMTWSLKRAGTRNRKVYGKSNTGL